MWHRKTDIVHLHLWLAVFCSGLYLSQSGKGASTRPDYVNIGAMLSYNSTVGKVAKVALEAAVHDVNSSPAVLGGTKLKLAMQNTNDSGFLGIVEGLSFMGKEMVAIIGPQTSVAAHVLSFVANELQVPLLSFSATDPTLSSLQFPFFLRTTMNDLFQMAAVAETVEYFEWREVIAIFVDDDSGRNGIDALGDKLAERRCRISYKAPLSPKASRDDISDALIKVALAESRILVLHVHAPWALQVFEVAHYLGMMGAGYVWIATDWLSTILDTDSPLPSEAMDKLQGALTLRMYTPNSELKRNLVSRWSRLTSVKGRQIQNRVGLNTYGLFAYDTVWLLAHALDAFFTQEGNISFSRDSKFIQLRGGKLHLDALSIFNGGELLVKNILQVNMTGVTGTMTFTRDGNLLHPSYEIINVIGNGYRRLGYWSNYSGLSVVPPDLYAKPPNNSRSSQKLFGVIWPGQTTNKPRGWVFPNNGRYMRIGVPRRVYYREFVSQVDATDMFTGYCIDVFTAALNLLPYAVPYKFFPFGDGRNNPSDSELLRLMTAGVYDAAVGDIAIITNRTKMVDFTQPYIESGLVVVAPVRKLNSNAWAFLRPFSPKMWCIGAFFFLVVGVVVWILEHKRNDDFRGPPRQQVVTILWFSLSTLFFAHRENTVSTLGRMVLFIWLFLVLIINSSYTAGLTSILTVQQLSSPIKGIETLMSSNDPIGYQQGSFTRNYLIDELNIHASRLVPLNSPEQCAKALKDGPHHGGVAAVVDERAYMELFLSTRCEFTIVGQEFTKNGWGFAFPRDSPLAVDVSTAILKMSENGDLRRIHDKWLMRRACSSQGAKLGVDRLQLKSFWGLFAVCGLASLLALLVYFFQTVRQFSRHCPEELNYSGPSLSSSRLQSFLSFVDEKQEAESSSTGRKKQKKRASSGGFAEGEQDMSSRKVEEPFSRSSRINRVTVQDNVEA